MEEEEDEVDELAIESSAPISEETTTVTPHSPTDGVAVTLEIEEEEESSGLSAAEEMLATLYRKVEAETAAEEAKESDTSTDTSEEDKEVS